MATKTAPAPRPEPSTEPEPAQDGPSPIGSIGSIVGMALAAEKNDCQCIPCKLLRRMGDDIVKAMTPDLDGSEAS